jgi:large subunit ribosomal protein L18
MTRLKSIKTNERRRKIRVRARVVGNNERPRLTVNISNYHITAQIIDDSRGSTLAYITTVGKKMDSNLTTKAAWAGAEIALKAKKAKVNKVVFDRGSQKYHGRIKSLAEAARSNGLEF